MPLKTPVTHFNGGRYEYWRRLYCKDFLQDVNAFLGGRPWYGLSGSLIITTLKTACSLTEHTLYPHGKNRREQYGKDCRSSANVDQTSVGSGAHEVIFQDNEWSYLPVNDPGGTVLILRIFWPERPIHTGACAVVLWHQQVQNDQLLSTRNKPTRLPCLYFGWRAAVRVW